MTALRFSAFTLLLLATACSHRVPVVTVEVIDTSMSITPRAERAAQTAVGNQISRMGRGDRLILIPITGDAENDAGGRVLRLTAPTERESYDTDLRRFQSDAQKQFATWAASLHPDQARTDILGTLDAARQEFTAIPNGSERRLIIVSDFLEDESSYRFVSAPQLASAASARALASSLRSGRSFALPGVPICLGRLESSDFESLSPDRKNAIQAFWTVYLADKERRPELHFDGTGMLADTYGCSSGSNLATTN
jgi:hypothetical protein